MITTAEIEEHSLWLTFRRAVELAGLKFENRVLRAIIQSRQLPGLQPLPEHVRHAAGRRERG